MIASASPNAIVALVGTVDPGSTKDPAEGDGDLACVPGTGPDIVTGQ